MALIREKQEIPGETAMCTNKRLVTFVATSIVVMSTIQPAQAGPIDVVKERTATIINKVNFLIDALRDGRRNMTNQIYESIDEAIDTAKSTLDDEKQGRADFIDRGCDNFKVSTTDMLMASQDAVASALGLAEIDGGLFNTERARTKISNASCRLLYPVYRAVGPGLEQAQAELTMTANATSAGFIRLKGLLDDATAPLVCQSNDDALCAILVNRKCGTYVRNATEINQILGIAKKAVIALKVSGKVADAAGKIGVWKAAVAVWGWVGSDIEFNLPEFLSKTTEAVAEAIDPVVTKQRNQLRQCVDIYAQDLTLGKLNKLLANGSSKDEV